MNSNIKDQLVEKIYNIQKNADRKYWPEGIFLCFRKNNLLGYKRPDNSIFYTASIVLILQKYRSFLSEKSIRLADEIIAKSINNYQAYQNKTGIFTYNFYPTRPSKHFANGLIFKHFKHFQLPDDADDTALIYLTNPRKLEYNIWLQKKLVQHANNPIFRIKNVFEKYKIFNAYSTWFGKKMPVEFDICVLSNILLWHQKSNLELDAEGKASWELIKESILSSDYLKFPFKMSHNYSNKIVIAYHFARLLEETNLPGASIIKSKLINDLKILEAESHNNYLYKILISNSLSLLGIKNDLEINLKKIEIDSEKFSFFLAGLLSSYNSPFLQKIAHFRLFHIHWYCKAHSLALVLENECLSKNELNIV